MRSQTPKRHPHPASQINDDKVTTNHHPLSINRLNPQPTPLANKPKPLRAPHSSETRPATPPANHTLLRPFLLRIIEFVDIRNLAVLSRQSTHSTARPARPRGPTVQEAGVALVVFGLRFQGALALQGFAQAGCVPEEVRAAGGVDDHSVAFVAAARDVRVGGFGGAGGVGVVVVVVAMAVFGRFVFSFVLL